MTGDKQYKRNGLFIVGKVLVILGAGAVTISPFLLYVYLLPLWAFLLGLILIWLTDRTVKTKVIWTVSPVVVGAAFQFICYQFSKAPAETFLIPQHYRGKIHIHFNEPYGQVADVVNGRRQYRVPVTGILLSRFTDKQGILDQQYFLIDSSGKSTILPQLDVRDYNETWTTEKRDTEPSRDILGVFHAGRVGSDGTYEFYVATYRQLKDTFGFHYNKYFDSIEQRMMEDCGRGRK